MDVEKIERELVKKALTQKLYLAQLQVLQNSCFWKKIFGGLLDNSFNEVAPELCTFSLINVLRTNNSFFQPQLPNLKILVLAHLQFSQNSFFQKTDIMHYWRALSMGLANKQSNVILLFLLGLHSEKIECELKKSAQPQLFAMAQLQFSQNSFF